MSPPPAHVVSPCGFRGPVYPVWPVLQSCSLDMPSLFILDSEVFLLPLLILLMLRKPSTDLNLHGGCEILTWTTAAYNFHTSAWETLDYLLLLLLLRCRGLEGRVRTISYLVLLATLNQTCMLNLKYSSMRIKKSRSLDYLLSLRCKCLEKRESRSTTLLIFPFFITQIAMCGLEIGVGRMTVRHPTTTYSPNCNLVLITCSI